MKQLLILALLTTPLVAQVNTEEGPVSGEINGSTEIFRGIPYAAPPVGALRWKPPQPAPHRTGTFDATTFGNACAQLPNATPIGSEDCLYLNIWAPAAPGSSLRPVMFFMHGGGNTSGASSQKVNGALFFNGLHLAQNDNVVVVTINYRLGPFGFLAHPALTAEDANHSSGNYGLLDQIAALQWVSRNIRNFGGDPANITVFGQSAGATDTYKIYLSPLAAGLFTHVIAESGAPFKDQTLATAEAGGLRVANLLGCDTAVCLRSRSVSQLLKAVPADSGNDIVDYNPNIDGYALVDCTANVINSRSVNPPIIAGSNRDDGGSFIPDPSAVKTETDFETEVRLVIPSITDAGIAELETSFNATTYGNWYRALDALATDFLFGCGPRRIAGLVAPRQAKTFFYQFTHPLDGTNGDDVFHTEELRFVFGTLDEIANVTPSAREHTLATQMMSYWSNFARGGDPNGSGVPSWPAYTTAKDTNLVIDTPISTNTALEKSNCALIAGVLATEVTNPPPSPCRPLHHRAAKH